MVQRTYDLLHDVKVVLMIHCGSRGFGHQVATDALVSMEKAMKRDNIEVKTLMKN